MAATASLTRRVANGVSTVVLDRPGVHHPLHATLQRARRSAWRRSGRDDSGSG